MSIRTKVPALMIGASAAAIPIICMVAAVNMWYLLSSTPVPPGKMAIVNLVSLRDLLVSNLNIDALRTPSLIALLLMWLGGSSELNAVKASAAIGFSLAPLSVAITTYVLTRNAVLSALACVVSLFTPMLYTVAFSGDYTLLYSVTLSQTFLTLMLGVLSSHRKIPFVSALLVLPFAVLSDPLSPLLLLPAAFSIAALALVRCLQPSRVLFLVIASLMLSLFLYPLNIRSNLHLGDLRQDIWSIDLFWLLAPLALSSVAGIVTLYYLNRVVYLSVVLWLGSQLATVLLFAREVIFPALALFLMTISFAAILNLKQLMDFKKEDDKVTIVIHVERLLVVLLAGLIMASLLLPGSAQVRRPELEVEDNSVFQSAAEVILKESVYGKVGAPSRISGWLNALYGIDSVIPLSRREMAEMDAATETAFRIMTKYIMADEWQPLSSSRSPIIYYFDGKQFVKILHLDDGTNNMTVIESGKQWHEDMMRMKLISYEWGENEKELSLVMNFWKKGFNVTKTIRLNKDEPVIEILYLVKPNKEVILSDLKLPVYMEERNEARVEEVSINILRLIMKNISLDIEYLNIPFSPIYVKSPVQDYVVGQYIAEGTEIKAGVRITILNARDSQKESAKYSIFETIARHNIKYLLIPTPPPGLNFLEDSLEEINIVPVIWIKDSFTRVLLVHEGIKYWESPAFSTVVNEDHSNQRLRLVKYRTAGLLIDKEVKVNNSTLDLTYSISPAKNKTELLTFTLSFWIDFDRLIRSVKIDEELGRVELEMDVRQILIEVLKGKVIGIDVGEDPEFKQMRVQMQFSLSPNGDSVKVSARFDARLNIEYKLATRPEMNGEDVLIIGVHSGLFKMIYSNEKFTLYQILKTSSPILEKIITN
jgi:hypothetical protein